MLRIRTLVVVGGLCALTGWAQATPITDTFDLGDSGWRVNTSSYYELSVASTDAFQDSEGVWSVQIDVSKKFRFPRSLSTNLFPPITLDFIEDPNAQELVDRIYIGQETITNLTGEDWTGFDWVLFRHELASFNQARSNVTIDPIVEGFLILPFQQWQWSAPVVGDTEKLAVRDGLVPNGDTFRPGDTTGELVIDVADRPAGETDPRSFTFMQTPIPEPGSLTLMALGVAAVLRRRR